MRAITDHSLVELAPRMKDLFGRVERVDIREHEVADPTSISDRLRAESLSLLEQASALMRDIQACSEKRTRSHVDQSPSPTQTPPVDDEWDIGRTCDPYLTFERAIDAKVATGSRGPAVVEEIAFIAQLELAQRFERLSRMRASHGGPALLAECDSALRRIRKALTAVAVAMADRDGARPVLRFESELKSSLRVRRSYAKFRRRLREDGQPDEGTLHKRFRLIGTQIAVLVGSEAYPEMRVRDRLLLRSLQQRVLAWLRTEPSRARVRAGLRLWQDFSAFLSMLTLVNRRQELVEHDQEVIHEVLPLLEAETTSTPSAALEQLATLEGLDDALDALLRQGPDVPPRRCLSVLRRLAQTRPRTGGHTS